MTLSQLMALLLLLVPNWQEGGITFYYGHPFEGSPLKCPGYTYAPETGPWLATDIGWYEDGSVRCGDFFAIEFYDGTRRVARALDSGHLAGHLVWDSGLPFIADLPHYDRGDLETRTGRILNISAMLRKWEAYSDRTTNDEMRTRCEQRR